MILRIAEKYLTPTRKNLLGNMVIAVLVFTLLYYLTNMIEVRYGMADKTIDHTLYPHLTKKQLVKPLSLFDAFYFTLVTQTTVGYGSIRPPTILSQVVNIFQLLSIYKVVELAIL